MAKTKQISQVVTNFRKEVELAKEGLKKDLSIALRGLLQEVFDRIPTLQKLRWIQECDVYNDETYEFEIWDSLYVQITGIDAKDDDGDEEGFIAIEPGYGGSKVKDWEMHRPLEEFHNELEKIKDELEYTFGGAKITACRDSDDLQIMEYLP